jgi:hypothetical protein
MISETGEKSARAKVESRGRVPAARAGLKQMIDVLPRAGLGADVPDVQMILHLLDQAAVFVMPDGGVYIPAQNRGNLPYAAWPDDMPVIAIEYAASQAFADASPMGRPDIPAPDRVALAVSGEFMSTVSKTPGFAGGRGFAVISLFATARGGWQPVPGMAFVRPAPPMIGPEAIHSAAARMLSSGMPVYRSNCERIPVPLMPGLSARMDQSVRDSHDRILLDTQDEVLAAADFLTAMGAANVAVRSSSMTSHQAWTVPSVLVLESDPKDQPPRHLPHGTPLQQGGAWWWPTSK